MVVHRRPLEPYQLDRLIRKIKCSFDLSDCLEFTVEAGRPDSITYEKLKVLRQHGISRISINPQTMKQETLKLIGRHHTVEQTVESFHMARELGFDNINMDLIMGLPEETLDDVRRTMEQVAELAPDNLTVHSLALKRAARLNMFKEDYKDYKIINTQSTWIWLRTVRRRWGFFHINLYLAERYGGQSGERRLCKRGHGGRVQCADYGGETDHCGMRSGSFDKTCLDRAGIRMARTGLNVPRMSRM